MGKRQREKAEQDTTAAAAFAAAEKQAAGLLLKKQLATQAQERAKQAKSNAKKSAQLSAATQAAKEASDQAAIRKKQANKAAADATEQASQAAQKLRDTKAAGVKAQEDARVKNMNYKMMQDTVKPMQKRLDEAKASVKDAQALRESKVKAAQQASIRAGATMKRYKSQESKVKLLHTKLEADKIRAEAMKAERVAVDAKKKEIGTKIGISRNKAKKAKEDASSRKKQLRVQMKAFRESQEKKQKENEKAAQ